MQTREDRLQLLEEEIDDWRNRLKKALLNIENQKRIELKFKPYPKDIEIGFPSGVNADLFLLTLKVWCLRYYVTPEFLVEQILTLYKGARKIPVGPHGELHIGLGASVMAGVRSRSFLEESIGEAYPNKENYKILAQPVPPNIPKDDCDTIEQMIERYEEHLQKARHRFDTKMHSNRRSLRNYRNSLQETI